MKLALFDLDNTLLAADSDYEWGEFLVNVGAVDAEAYKAENQKFYDAYLDGSLDIHAFLRFSLRPLAEHPLDKLLAWRETFVRDVIRPLVAPGAMALLDQHRAQEHELVIITATNDFITAPIAELLGVEQLIATHAGMRDGYYTGESPGIPCFQAGKITRLDAWLLGREPEEICCYSDSHNDLPLLERADHPTAVDPDPSLRETANARGWPIITLRNGPEPEAI